ncbi:hypothetical protein [Nocardia flavorosea]|uniref:Uncharacterized protein n=1 Tax=Nocardia flavorosea TaxID=53429 RepID=A0A846YLJ5_9NOCA|nr:hypothetical protein [Nocardia flavorosea]NKY58372.1 hypothetical protein [Nocardia flavorosea]
MPASAAAVSIDVPTGLGAPVPWALATLTGDLNRRGVRTDIGNSTASITGAVIRVRVDRALGPDESFLIESGPAPAEVVVRAAEARGAAYGLSELADRVRYGEDPVEAIRSARCALRSPAVPVRSVLRSFSSDVLDLPWLRDHDFWTEYLDELATQRINRLHLALGMQYNFSHDSDVRDNYLCFAYPFLLEVPGWENVRVTGVSDANRAANLAALRFAGDEAARRGIHFQLGLWNHAVRPELGESPNLRYRITGLADRDIAEYSAAALRLLLRECPAIAGLTLRVHYEGGVAETERSTFWRTVLGGVRDTGRPLEIDLHAKGVDGELLTTAAGTGGRVVISAKYWAEHQGLPYHQAAIRPMEFIRRGDGDGLRGVTQNARRFTRYGYADFLRRDRQFDLLFRIWPGSQRFLLWADPQIFAGYGRMSSLGGAVGAELCEPLTFRGRKDTGRAGMPRDLYADPALSLGRADWRKYSYQYRLWGRLLFDPDADRESWLRYLGDRFGTAAELVERALGAAGKVLPLVTIAVPASASNNFFWPEVFTDHPIAGQERRSIYAWDLLPPRTWGTISPLDPALFESADDYARGLIDGRPSGRHTPVQVASWLEHFADVAEAAIGEARESTPDRHGAEFRRIEVDVRAQALLGRFFAGKIRAGVGYALFRLTGDTRHLREGIDRYHDGRAALTELIALTREVYVTDLAFGRRPGEHGHWTDRLPAIDADIADLLDELAAAEAANRPILALVPPDQRSAPVTQIRCTPPDNFVPGERLTLRAHAPAGVEVTVHARHLDQSEHYLEMPMTREDEAGFTATLPAEYTDSPYAIQFFLLARDRTARTAWIVPGLDESLANQPYFVIPAETA